MPMTNNVSAVAFLLTSTLIATVSCSKGFPLPPLGFNNCNLECCNATMPSASFLRATANDMITLGFAKAGYTYVNMDDCWMLAQRSQNGTGPQVPDPAKFPDGVANVSAYIHHLGLKFGLYTAQAHMTCGGRAGSCGFESIDAAQYASWGVDYVKDDRCGGCGIVLNDIHHMQSAIDNTSRIMYLSVEGNPDVPTVSKNPNLYGNTIRVGHDIMATWYSMWSLIDAGSGLWPFAHNDTGLGGYYNDIDMMEIGNPGDFHRDLDRIKVHFTMWVILKAPILMGTVLRELTQEIIDIVTNPEALAIHQDPWGKQARRVSSTDSTAGLSAPFNALVVMAPCTTNRTTQVWRYNNTDGTLYTLDSQGTSWCVGPTAIPWGRPYEALPCKDPKYKYNASADCGPPNVCTAIASWQMNGKKKVQFMSTTGGGALGYDNTPYASGPLPHTRYMFENYDTFYQFNASLPQGSTIRPLPTAPPILDDDQIGHVTTVPADTMCLDVVRGGNLEVWAAPLSAHRIVVAFVNRSPTPSVISVTWDVLGVDPNTNYVVRDVWEGANKGTFKQQYSAVTPATGVVLLVLTPK